MIYTQPTIANAMPTDAEWGRLYNYDTTGDAGLVMPYRSSYFRNFVAGGWMELAIGMIYRNSGTADDTSALVAERQGEIAVSNLPHFGLSQVVNGRIDVANNRTFLGLRGIIGGTTQLSVSPPQIAHLKLTAVSGNSTILAGANQSLSLKSGVSATPFAMVGMKYMRNANDGRIYIKLAANSNLALADDAANTTTLSEFLADIDNSVDNANASFAFSNPLNLSAFFLYWPYLNNRMMLHTVGAVKYG